MTYGGIGIAFIKCKYSILMRHELFLNESPFMPKLFVDKEIEINALLQKSGMLSRSVNILINGRLSSQVAAGNFISNRIGRLHLQYFWKGEDGKVIV